MASKRLLRALALVLATAGCHGKGGPEDGAATGPGKATPAVSTEAPAHAGTATATPQPAPPLTQEEKDLIAADPATLTPEQRRARAYALRKKIMQDPSSPAARELRRVGEALERGEIDVSQIGLGQKHGRDGTNTGTRSPAAPPAGD
jgi:hypothetical protein